jgi:hypothetical protein
MQKRLRNATCTLTDADISSTRAVSRRSLLSSLGLGVAAAVIVRRPGAAAAQGTGCTDNDQGPDEDPMGFGRRCRGRQTGCTDTDRGPNEDPPGRGRGCWV